MAFRALVGTVCTGVLVAALLVSPALCLGSAAQSSVGVLGADVPVPRALREDPATPVRVVDQAAVLRGVDAAAAAALVGAVVVDPQGRTVLQTPGADRPVPSASLVKLLVVQQLLARAGPAGWDEATLGLMERAITVSDDTAMNLLWVAHDGPALVRDAVVEFRLTGTGPPAAPGQWGQATTTASDLARFLSTITATPAAPDSAAVLGWMRAAAPTAADGFDQTFGLLAGAAGAGVAAKQGWMCCVDGRQQLHSAGVLADGRVVVVLGDVPAGTTWERTAAAVDGVTAALVAGTR